MVYQTFSDQKGTSNSLNKLYKIKFPYVKGKRVLDIGCNEGFFCIEAKKRGAIKVVGIDKNPKLIEKAKKRAPDIDFRTQDWDNLPNEEFDVILLLSTLHYSKTKQKLIDDIYKILSPEGIFILECGGVPGPGKDIEMIRKNGSMVYHPTWKFLTKDLLKNFKQKDIGISVKKDGEGVERRIFHCKKLNSIEDYDLPNEIRPNNSFRNILKNYLPFFK